MRTTHRRAAAIAAAAAFISGPLAFGSASAAEEPLAFAASDVVVAPGGLWEADPVQQTGPLRRGTMVVAVSGKPLTGTVRALPASLHLEATECQAVSGRSGIYTCERTIPASRYSRLTFHVDATTPDAEAHYGFVFVPRGGDVDAAVADVVKADASPTDSTHGHGALKIVTKTTAAARNTVAFDTPAVPAGRTVRHKLRIHATDPGKVFTRYMPADGQPEWRKDEVLVKDVTATSGASCTVDTHHILGASINLDCTVGRGDHTIEYTVAAPAGMDTWKLDTHVVHDIYDYAHYGSALDRKATFTAGTGDLRPRHDLITRDASGALQRIYGTGSPAKPFGYVRSIGGGWGVYSQITKLEPVSENLYYFENPVPTRVERGHGDLVARDASGTLWYYQRQFNFQPPYKARTKVGTGWNTYTTITGAGDLDGDKKSDLLARDKTGVLWLYKGTGKTTAPFATRTRIGGGWGTYNMLAGSADLTGDGKPDLLARDGSGALWLHKGTGKASAPFAARTKVGGGWQGYNTLSVVGDVTDNGKADLVARDKAGVLWLYKGSGQSSAPFAARTKIGTGWQMYNSIV
ncbi:FG-GAP repeat domain-containing protein [Streptomyces sp. NPDC093225]|uniref:FG-GAP repeat domain-containing protein n=1 Tax=Streptomyces sp. NPDC093225 TaxID=3366034 RepID=UPI00381723DC